MEGSLSRLPREYVSLAIFGVRHHGPGSARSVVRALETFAPEIVLIEGPPEANEIVPLAADPAMQPPVAILAYAIEDTKRAAFYPFATFSPEWQAIGYALRHAIPARFIDLPLANVFAATPQPDGDASDNDSDDREANDAANGSEANRHRDPIAEIARQAGYDDSERWWDRFVERRGGDGDAFATLDELMGILRAQREPYVDREEERREAAMRQAIRTARKAFARVAVVCGAWHAPALRREQSAASDATILRGLPKARVAATWIPWTHGRLSYASGYGAGVTAPGWYQHLWVEPHDRIVTSWMTKAARTLRDGGLDIASAHAIEATRLAETLAALREAPVPGLDDLTDAIESTYCFGDATPLALLHEKLIVGERLGAVPDHVTKIPLLADLAREQKRLRLVAEAEARAVDLDLRKPHDLERSRLLHRLAILGVSWGRLGDANQRGMGTFRERWELRWQPEFAVALVEKSAYGNAIVDATQGYVLERAARASDLRELAGLLDATLLADLSGAVDAVLGAVRDSAARTHDVDLLLDAIPSLARVRRYGDVRQTDLASVGSVVETLIVRACVALPAASLSLDDDAATRRYEQIVTVDSAIRTLELTAERDLWNATLEALSSSDRVHGIVAGRATRLLFDGGAIEPPDLRRRLGVALGLANDPARVAAWLEGAFAKSGLILVHRHELLDTIDAWLATLDAETFTATVPAIRRTFGSFETGERSAIASRLARSHAGDAVPRTSAPADDDAIDWDRARAIMPVLWELLGPTDAAAS